MYILLIQPPPALQPSPCPVPPLVFKAAVGGMLAAAVAALLCCAHGVQILPALPPNSLPLITQAGAAMLVLIIVGTLTKGGPFVAPASICFLSASFQQIFSVSHPQSSQVLVVPSLAPGQGSHSRGWWQGLVGKRLLGCVAGTELFQPHCP